VANTHAMPDVMGEIMAREGDLLPAAIVSQSPPAVPAPPSMTLAPFGTLAYVRAGTPAHLTYVHQPPQSVTLTGADGGFWLAVHANTHTPVASWTRTPGTHYLWRPSATRPADPPDALMLAGLTVAGGVITAVDAASQISIAAGRVAYGGPTGALAYDPAFTWDRTAGLLGVGSGISINTPPDPLYRLRVGTGASYFTSQVGIGIIPSGSYLLEAVSALISTIDCNGTLEVTGQVGLGIPADPLYSLKVSGASYFMSQVGFGTAPSGSYLLEGVSALISTLDCNGTLAVTGYTGLNTPADPLYSLKVSGASYFASQVGIGVIPSGGALLEAVSALISTIDCNGTLEVTGQVGLGTAADPLYRLKVSGASYFDSQVGIGVIPSGGYLLETGSALMSTIDCNGTLEVTGQTGLGIAADPLYRLKVSGASYFGSQVGFGTPPSGAYLLEGVSCLISTIDCNGTASKPGGGPWDNYTSSQALKQDLAPLTGALATVLQLQGHTWRWADTQRDLERLLPGPQIGFVLEEVAQVMPQWVSTNGRGQQGYGERGLSALLVEALREIVARLEALEAR
jgi:Chaperone of endosialidase